MRRWACYLNPYKVMSLSHSFSDRIRIGMVEAHCGVRVIVGELMDEAKVPKNKGQKQRRCKRCVEMEASEAARPALRRNPGEMWERPTTSTACSEA